ncbi:GNAT family N-acetyltransferase [Demequina sp. NBRC 110057]|uniref:GNAT family N-acetyltransferase n=1 Tax=Demequina sp. NBRC 110057 TaxID=1570346 RepID=UPI000A00A269|nr:GNAT family N-acetyltransferase [Demequina sp. NBRC 110057]
MTAPFRVPVRVETERLVLRHWDPDRDVDDYHALIVDNADRLRRWMPWAAHEPLSRADHAQWLAQCAAWAEQGGRTFLAITDAATGRVIGSAGLHPTNSPRTREIGYWLAHGSVGRGLATEVVVALTEVALGSARANRIEILTLPDNASAIAVARRAGFHDEGLTHDTHAGVPMALWAAGHTWNGPCRVRRIAR